MSQLEQDLTTLHLRDLPPSVAPVLPQPLPPDLAAITVRHAREATRGLSWFARAERAAAKTAALVSATAEAEAEWSSRWSHYTAEQQHANATWQALATHDPAAVLTALEDAFEDNQSPAACVAVDTEDQLTVATVVVLFGGPDMIPDRKPAVTPSGTPTLQKRTKTERNAVYGAALGSTVLATVKETFTASPATAEVRVVVVRRDQERGPSYLGVIYAAQFPRRATMSLDWSAIDPLQTISTAPHALIRRTGVAAAISDLDLTSHPDLEQVRQAVVDGVDESD